MSAIQREQPAGAPVTPARAERAARVLLQAIAQAHAILSERADLSAGDQELAAELLPAWWSAFGSRALSVAELWAVHEGTALAQVLRRLEARAVSVHGARKGCGKLLKRLADCGIPVAGFKVVRLAVQSGSAIWECRPSAGEEDGA